MTLRTVSINVLDFDVTAGAPPASARVEVARMVIGATSGTLVSTRPSTIRLVAGVGTIQLEGNDFYAWQFRGVRGLEQPYFVRTPDADTDAATLWSAHQIDPTSVAPIVLPPSTQQLLDDLAATAADLDAISIVATAHPGEDDLVDLTFPAQLLNPNDVDLVTLTIGGS